VVGFASIEEAVTAIAAGQAVVVVDDEDRENEGDLIFAAEKATPELMAFTVRHSSGYICVALTEADCDRLDLPPMHHTNQDLRGTAYTVTVDAAEDVSTGISATDRARTTQVLASADSDPTSLRRPGHVVPLRAREGGVLRRPGHTEAAVDLARMAGLRPAGVLCEVVSERDPGDMARLPELRTFAEDHGLCLISIAQLVEHRLMTEVQVRRVVESVIPTAHGPFRALGYVSTYDDQEHLALTLGDFSDGAPVLVRVHSECLMGDAFGSRRCECGRRLDSALEAIATEGRGALVYMRGHDGRVGGVLHKLLAYELLDTGQSGPDTNPHAGMAPDGRDYGTGAQILVDLGIRDMRLLSSSLTPRPVLEGYGLRIVEQVPLTRPDRRPQRT
jgi:3,4-dihydroxy 2-butanone 4-phosphate synthase/GTP cyclohydrolase II